MDARGATPCARQNGSCRSRSGPSGSPASARHGRIRTVRFPEPQVSSRARWRRDILRLRFQAFWFKWVVGYLNIRSRSDQNPCPGSTDNADEYGKQDMKIAVAMSGGVDSS